MGRFSAPHCHPSRNLFILPPPAIDRRYLCRSPPGNFEIKHFWMIFVKVPEVLVLVKWFAFENPPELPLALRHVAKVRVRGRRMGTPVSPVGIFALFLSLTHSGSRIKLFHRTQVFTCTALESQPCTAGGLLIPWCSGWSSMCNQTTSHPPRKLLCVLFSMAAIHLAPKK